MQKIEGCSDRTLQYYQVTVEHLLSQIKTSVRKITTEEIRAYLADYQNNSKCSNVTIDKIKTNLCAYPTDGTSKPVFGLCQASRQIKSCSIKYTLL